MYFCSPRFKAQELPQLFFLYQTFVTFIIDSSSFPRFLCSMPSWVHGSVANLSGNDAYDELFPNAMMGGAMMTTHSDDSDEEDDKMPGFLVRNTLDGQQPWETSAFHMVNVCKCCIQQKGCWSGACWFSGFGCSFGGSSFLFSDSERMDDAELKRHIHIFAYTMHVYLYIQLGRTHGKAKHYKYPRYHW